MKETLEQANKANKDFEAATFVNRLKRAANEHDGYRQRSHRLNGEIDWATG